jgi:chemotaxis response regulator CheB
LHPAARLRSTSSCSADAVSAIIGVKAIPRNNFVNRTIGAKQLSVLGYTAEVVDGARRGLEVVQSGRSDIVLMDCEMPEMDG